MISCRVCGNQLEKFMSFGKMPIANRFLLPEQFDSEYFFELAPAFCKSCFTFQIIEQPSPEKMFHNNYAFYSSTSRYKTGRCLKPSLLVANCSSFIISSRDYSGALASNRHLSHLFSGAHPDKHHYRCFVFPTLQARTI